MTDKAPPESRMTGITSFSDDGEPDYIAPPSREVREQAKAVGAAMGFVSDKPLASSSTDAIETAPKKRTRAPSQYPDHYNLRLRTGDRERFDDYAYRHRLPKGEVFRIMLDLIEEREAEQVRAGNVD